MVNDENISKEYLRDKRIVEKYFFKMVGTQPNAASKLFSSNYCVNAFISVG